MTSSTPTLSASQAGSSATSVTLLSREQLLDQFPESSTPNAHAASFSEMVTAFIHEAVSTMEKSALLVCIKAFFAANYISDELGLASVSESDLPAYDSKNSATDPWKVLPVRRTLLTIVDCSKILVTCNRRLDPSIKLSHLRALSSSKVSPPATLPSVVTTVKDDKKVDKIPSFTLPEFSGAVTDIEDWYQKAKKMFGSAGVDKYLADEVLCDNHDEWSYAFTCRLQDALSSGFASHLNSIHEKERNCARFFKLIKDNYDITAENLHREFQQWISLFTITLESSADFDCFINKYETAVSRLRKFKSTAVDDNALMRALLVQALRTDEFKAVKVEINKDMTLSPKEIVAKLRAHHLALESDEKFTGSKPGSTSVTGSTRSIRRGESSKATSYKIPTWPTNLSKCISESVYKQLNFWKMLVNNPRRNAKQQKQLDSFEIAGRSSSPTSRDRSRDSHKDRGRDRKRPRKDTHKRDNYRRSRRTERSPSRSRSPSPSRSRSRDRSPPDRKSRSGSPARTTRRAQRHGQQGRSAEPPNSRGGILFGQSRSHEASQRRAGNS